jgi:acetyl/propionyl-CoA carboxylase alpha subunit
MKIFVANRGEIALRIMRTCREMGLETVAVYSSGEEGALHVRYAGEAVSIGDAQNYLNLGVMLEAIRRSGAQAVHPGYGFLSENADFAQAVERAGLAFIGPTPKVIARMGDKIAARRIARHVGLPVLPGPDAPLPRETPLEIMQDMRFPVLVKAAAGGGGRGIRVVRSRDELPWMADAAREEALAAFGNDTLYVEPLVRQARHIEVQILGDGQGQVIALGERDCSVQRRHQKVIEESPAPNLPEAMREMLAGWAVRIGQAMRYRSLGTVEFLVSPRGQAYFIEVNPRIQVEHGVTEMVTGLDLVKAQLQLALDGHLPFDGNSVWPRGVAIEARVLAEDPEDGFLPDSGEIRFVREPAGPGVRVDSALYPGAFVSPSFDPLLAKVIAWGSSRDEALARLRRALEEFRIAGVHTNIDFLQRILESSSFRKGRCDVTFLDGFQASGRGRCTASEKRAALAVALLAAQSRAQDAGLVRDESNLWRRTAWGEQIRTPD